MGPAPRYPVCSGNYQSQQRQYPTQKSLVCSKQLLALGLLRIRLIVYAVIANAIIRHGSQDRTLAARPLALVQRLAQLHLYTTEDIYGLCGNTPTPASLAKAIQRPGDSRAYNTRCCRNFLVDCDITLRVLRHLPYGPRPSKVFASAFHNWVIGEHQLEDLTVAKVRKHLLPVYADFLFRLQHNALYLGYQFQHIQDAKTTCHFDCEHLETLSPCSGFALCLISMVPFSPVFSKQYCKRAFLGNTPVLLPTPAYPGSQNKYGSTLFVVLNFLRAIVTRCIWMHRKEMRFHDQVSNYIDTRA
ncbi:hypothetical protein Plhal304r1_c021g0075641 [Plasmopara halstedii]